MNKIIRISFSGLLFIVLGLFVLSTGSVKAANPDGCYDADKNPTNGDVNGVDQAGNNLSTLDQNGNTLSSQNCYVVTSKTGVSPVVYKQVQCSDLTTPITPTATPNQDPNVVCANSGGAMAWVVCPVIEAIGHGEELFINMINTQLKTKPVNLTSDTDPVAVKTKAIWTNFRFIGNLVLVIAVLVIVYAEAVGGSIADAYTVQKTLPRILITAMLINLSIYLMLGLQDIFNVLGSGISDLILQPFKSGGGGGLINISAGTGALFTAGSVGLGLIGVAALTSGIVPILLLLGLSGLLALTGVFVTVILRQGILFMLVVTSPVAFALYCLPNTEQYFKKWWNFSIKILMVYPIVNVVIALAYVSGFVLSQINGGTGGQLLAAIASMLPLFLIPFAFKMSGGAMASIYGAVSGVTNRLRKPINKLAGNVAKKKASQNLEKARSDNYFKNANNGRFRSRLNRGMMVATSPDKLGANPAKWRSKAGDLGTFPAIHEADQAMEKNELVKNLNEDTVWKMAAESTSHDDFVRRMRESGMSETETESNANNYRQIRSSMSEDAFKLVAVKKAIAGGTAVKDSAEFVSLIASATKGNSVLMQKMVADGRNLANSAGRFDLGKAGFGAVLTATKEMNNLNARLASGNITKDQYNIEKANIGLKVAKDAALSCSPAEMVYGKAQSVKNLGAAMAEINRDRIKSVTVAQTELLSMEQAQNTPGYGPTPIEFERITFDSNNNPTFTKVTEIPTQQDVKNQEILVKIKQREAVQGLATLNGTLQAMSQASPKNAAILSDELVAADIDVDSRMSAFLPDGHNTSSGPLKINMQQLLDIISKKQDNNDYKQMSYSAYMSGIDPNQLAAAARNAGQGGPTPTINNP